MQIYLCMCLCLGTCPVHLLDRAGFHFTAAFQQSKTVLVFFFSGESDHCCIIKEISPKATPTLPSQEDFWVWGSWWRKLLGVVLPAHPRSVLGCPDNILTAPLIEFVGFTSGSKRQGNSRASNKPQCFSRNTSGTWLSNTFWRKSVEKQVWVSLARALLFLWYHLSEPAM